MISISDPLLNDAGTSPNGAAPAPPATPINATAATVPAPAPANTATPVQHVTIRPAHLVMFALAVLGVVWLLRKL